MCVSVGSKMKIKRAHSGVSLLWSWNLYLIHGFEQVGKKRLKKKDQRAMYAGFNSEIWLKLQKNWLP